MELLAENRRARFEHEILETYEAGIVLNGQEVKSIKAGKANLTGAFVIVKPNSAFLLNAEIPPYQPKNAPASYESSRSRRLLLEKKELAYLSRKTNENNLTIIPLSLYNKNRRIKISIGLAKHKKKYDKREAIKKRETQREIRRTLK